jgi:hypothetical protein
VTHPPLSPGVRCCFRDSGTCSLACQRRGRPFRPNSGGTGSASRNTQRLLYRCPGPHEFRSSRGLWVSFDRPIDNPGAWRRATVPPDGTTKSSTRLGGSAGGTGSNDTTAERGSSSEERRADRVTTTNRSRKSDNGGADRRIGFGAPAEMAGSARFEPNGVRSTELTTGGTDRCRRA